MLYQQRVIQEVAKHWSTMGRCFMRVTPPALRRQALQLVLNRALRQSLERDELAFFHNKRLNLNVTDLPLHMGIILVNRELRVTAPSARADVSLAATSRDLILVAAQEVDVDRLFFQRRLQISGDTQLGLSIKNLLASQDLSELLPPSLLKLLGIFASALALT